jgi:hypothetical protein
MTTPVLTINYTGTGSVDTYAIPFDYDLTSQVIVTWSAGGSPTYTFPSAGFIQLSAPLGNGVVLTIARYTNTDLVAETFQAGSGIPKSKLNSAFRQCIFAIQELYLKINQTSVTAGAVPIPGASFANKYLKAISATAWTWTVLAVAELSDASANAKSLLTAANYAAMKVLLGLDLVNNTTDATKPVSTPQQTALDLKLNIIGGGLAHSRGRIITVLTDTTISVALDHVAGFDPSGRIVNTMGGFTDTINLANPNGISALDTGTIANGTWYYVFGIYNPTTLTWKAMISASFSAPTMPTGYTYKIRLGTVRYGTAKLVRTIQYGRNVRYVFGNTPAQTNSAEVLIASGIQGTIATPVFAAFNVDNFFPYTSNAKVVVMGWCVAGSCALATNNTTTFGTLSVATGPVYGGIQTTGTRVNHVYEVVQEGHNLYWACNVATGGIIALGWEELD